MRRTWLLLVLVVLVLLVPRLASADKSTAHSVSVAVLAFDSDDAEEHADALTGALRSRIRASQGWSLVETSQSLGMLTAALRCPGKPLPPECEHRIAEQIKSERYMFGYVTKGPQPSQVTAEIHLYQKGKPDAVIRESYADNLKEQNDDTLRKIAQRVLDRLGGTAVGTILVRLGAENGEVVIDGDKRLPLQSGTARLELSPGSHSVEVVVTGQPPQKRTVLVTAGKETVIELALVAPPPEPPKPSAPFPTRKVVGGGLVAVGLAAGAVSVINVLAFTQDREDGEKWQNDPNTQVQKLPPNQTADDACGGKPLDDSTEICKANSDAKRHSTVALIAGIGGGALVVAGAYLLFTRGSGEKDKTAASKSTGIRAVPSLGQSSGGVMLMGRF